MKKLKLRPKVCNSEMGYYILSPIYAGINCTYLSHWQQISPYYYRLGNLKNWIERNSYGFSVYLKWKLLKEIDNLIKK